MKDYQVRVVYSNGHEEVFSCKTLKEAQRIYYKRRDALSDELTGEIVPEAHIELVEVLDQWTVTAPVPDEAGTDPGCRQHSGRRSPLSPGWSARFGRPDAGHA